MRLWEVGGCTRDSIMGRESNDVDYAVEAPSYHRMCETLDEWGFEEFVANPEFVTTRRKVPVEHPLYMRTNVADFVLCRKDGPSDDARHPDYVEAGDIYDDLARRDFTMNAIAYDPIADMWLDPHGGRQDIEDGVIRFVGNPMNRIREDALRVLRGLRFQAVLGFKFTPATKAAIESVESAELLSKLPVDRCFTELQKMFGPDNFVEAFHVMSHVPDWTREAIFRDGLRLVPTLAKRATHVGG